MPTELLEWLGIPPRHQVMRDSMLDTGPRGPRLDGVVLLDLPDHDSTEVSHHLEVDRLVQLADLLVWVLDPQKYADAAIHDRYLAPYATHQDVMLVVLNHIDTVPEGEREAMVADVRRLLDADGLDEVPVLAVSAREGIGMRRAEGRDRRAGSRRRSRRASRVEADVARRGVAARGGVRHRQAAHPGEEAGGRAGGRLRRRRRRADRGRRRREVDQDPGAAGDRLAA